MSSITWTIQVVVCSILLIALVHHLFHYLKNTLTTPKIKYLDNFSNKYENMYRIIQTEPTPTITQQHTQPQHQHPQQNQNIDISQLIPNLDNSKSSNLDLDLNVDNTSSIFDLPIETISTPTQSGPSHKDGENTKENMKNALKDFLKSSKDDIVPYTPQ
jgi:hypothetical protein